MFLEKKEDVEEQQVDVKRDVWEWMESLSLSVVVLILVFVFVFRIAGVSGSSMEETFSDGDRILISSMFYTPSRGDVVVVNQPGEFGKPIIKRIIAMEHETIDIDFETGVVTIDGEVLDEPYIANETLNYYDLTFPQIIPDGCVFVMGDNRQGSLDSRSSTIGMIDTRYILGKAFLRIFPFDRITWFG